jgi:hypothetical protein
MKPKSGGGGDGDISYNIILSMPLGGLSLLQFLHSHLLYDDDDDD